MTQDASNDFDIGTSDRREVVVSDAIRPCPVCGKEPTITHYSNHGNGLWTIGCGGEGQGHHLWLAKAGASGLENAIKAWNRRAS